LGIDGINIEEVVLTSLENKVKSAKSDFNDLTDIAGKMMFAIDSPFAQHFESYTANPDNDSLVPETKIETMSFGQKLKACRRLSGLSMRETAKLSGISLSYISKLQRDEIKQPSIKVLEGLSKTLDISFEELASLVGYQITGMYLDENYIGALKTIIEKRSLTPKESQELADYLVFIRNRVSKTS